MLQVTWTIEGERQLSRRISKIGDEIKDWTNAFKEAGQTIKDVFANEVFSSEGAVIGESWPALKPQYLAAKRKQGYTGGILVKTSLMKNSFRYEYDKHSAIIWNSADYFKYHQSKGARRRLPRRVMMKLGTTQREIIMKIFHTYWHKKVNA